MSIQIEKVSNGYILRNGVSVTVYTRLRETIQEALFAFGNDDEEAKEIREDLDRTQQERWNS